MGWYRWWKKSRREGEEMKKRRKIFVRLDSVNENIKKERRKAMFGEQRVT